MIKKTKTTIKQKRSSSAAPKALSRSPSSPVEQKNFSEHYELSAKYDTTKLVLIPRDPYWAHAYWEISEADKESMSKKIGKDFDRSAYVLRIYDVTCIEFNGRNAHHAFDIEVDPQAHNRYLNFWKSGGSYCGEVGVRTPSGAFHAFARSNFITTPPESSPGRNDVIWMEVDNNNPRSFVVLDESAAKGKKHSSRKGTVKGRRKIYLSEKNIRDYYSQLFPLLKLLRGRGSRSKRSSELDNYLLSGLTKEEFLRRLRLGASAEMVLKDQRGGASESLFSGASENNFGQHKFFFEIWAELLVYGRTEADAQVKLGSKLVPLRSDGTFTLRYELPDGKIPFDFVATSADKLEQRRIVTAVERSETKYSS